LRQALAFTYMRLGEWNSAETMLTDLLRRRLALSGPRHPSTLRLQENLAQVRIAQGHAAMALPDLDQLYPNFVAVYGADHVMTLTLLSTRAQAYMALERYKDAETDQLAIYRMALAKYGDHSFMALGTLTDAADAECRMGQAAGLDNARKSYDGALSAFGASATFTQLARETLAFCLITDRQFTAAQPLLERLDVKAMAEVNMQPTTGAVVDLMRAAVAQHGGDTALASSLLSRAVPLLQADGTDPYMVKWGHGLLAEVKRP
jgi:hypothetical protein